MRDFEEDLYIYIYIRFTDSVWGKLDRGKPIVCEWNELKA